MRKLLETIPPYVDDIEKMNRHNKIFKMRAVGVTAISAEDAIDWGFTGPVLRAAGVPYDIRKWFPNYDYDQFEFDIPIGDRGDVYDRYLVRIEKSGRVCASSNKRWRICLQAPSRSTTAVSACPRKKASIRTSRI